MWVCITSSLEYCWLMWNLVHVNIFFLENLYESWKIGTVTNLHLREKKTSYMAYCPFLWLYLFYRFEQWKYCTTDYAINYRNKNSPLTSQIKQPLKCPPNRISIWKDITKYNKKLPFWFEFLIKQRLKLERCK